MGAKEDEMDEAQGLPRGLPMREHRDESKEKAMDAHAGIGRMSKQKVGGSDMVKDGVHAVCQSNNGDLTLISGKDLAAVNDILSANGVKEVLWVIKGERLDFHDRVQILI